MPFVMKTNSTNYTENRIAKLYCIFIRDGKAISKTQGHPTDRFGGISVQKTCNRLKCSVREMSSRAFLITCNAFCFRRDKNDVLGTKIGQLGFSERQ